MPPSNYAPVYTKYLRNKMQDSTFEEINFSNFSSFIFKVNHVFMEEKHNPLEKVVIVEKKIDYIEIDGV